VVAHHKRGLSGLTGRVREAGDFLAHHAGALGDVRWRITSRPGYCGADALDRRHSVPGGVPFRPAARPTAVEISLILAGEVKAIHLLPPDGLAPRLAREIKPSTCTLASQTATATEEISGQIRAIHSEWLANSPQIQPATDRPRVARPLRCASQCPVRRGERGSRKGACVARQSSAAETPRLAQPRQARR
jgi:hypothetical protein